MDGHQAGLCSIGTWNLPIKHVSSELDLTSETLHDRFLDSLASIMRCLVCRPRAIWSPVGAAFTRRGLSMKAGCKTGEKLWGAVMASTFAPLRGRRGRSKHWTKCTSRDLLARSATRDLVCLSAKRSKLLSGVCLVCLPLDHPELHAHPSRFIIHSLAKLTPSFFQLDPSSWSIVYCDFSTLHFFDVSSHVQLYASTRRAVDFARVPVTPRV